MQPIVVVEVRRIESELVQHETIDALCAIADQAIADPIRRQHFVEKVIPALVCTTSQRRALQIVRRHAKATLQPTEAESVIEDMVQALDEWRRVGDSSPCSTAFKFTATLLEDASLLKSEIPGARSTPWSSLPRRRWHGLEEIANLLIMRIQARDNGV